MGVPETLKIAQFGQQSKAKKTFKTGPNGKKTSHTAVRLQVLQVVVEQK